MPTTILTIVQDFTEKLGLPRPSAVVGVQEKSVRQFRALLQEAVSDLGEYFWESQKLRKTWLSVAGQDQGTLVSIFGDGYDALVPETMWNDDRHMRVFGPVTSPVWQAFQTLPNAGPEFQCWISGGHLYISPALEAGENMSAIYQSKYGVLAVDGTTTKERITADDDSLLFPTNVVLRALEWKWRKQKGESGWEDDYNAYITLVSRSLVKSGMPTLSLDGARSLTAKPGITIPAGSWNV